MKLYENKIFWIAVASVIVLAIIVAIYLINKNNNKGGSPVTTLAPYTTFSPMTTPHGTTAPLTPNLISLRKYFSTLFPMGNWGSVSEANLEKLYMSLDAWYETIIPKYLTPIMDRIPKWVHNPLFKNPPEPWCRLFDGDVCDCLRFTYPVCLNNSRFGGNAIEQSCPEWPGLKVGVSYSVIALRAFATNNKSGNFDPALVTNPGYGKGFPDDCWFEGLTYPGEYGLPEVCGKTLPKELQGYQPGLSYYTDDNDKTAKQVNIPWSDSPFWDISCTDYNATCASHGAQLAWMQCVKVASDGQFPKGGKTGIAGKYCISKDYLTGKPVVEGYRNNDLRLRGGISPPPANTCPGFPDVPCKDPDTMGYHGLWLYPLRGLGTWRNMGKSVVANTKLGYLLTPKPYGAGYTLAQLAHLITSESGKTNINDQVSMVKMIIQKGKLPRNVYMNKKHFTNISWNFNDLMDHLDSDFKKQNPNLTKQVKDDITSTKNALAIVSHWYISGHTGLGADPKTVYGGQSDGFNYNYKLSFPIGTYFGYSSDLDFLVQALLTYYKKDTLQILVEPQSATAGLRPAYFFEIFQITPSSSLSSTDVYTVSKDTSATDCGDYYTIDPNDDIDNYMNYGYVSGDKVKSVKKFDPDIMTLSPRNFTFTP